MSKRLLLTPHLSIDELARRYRQATDPVARSHWHIVWLLAQGQTTGQVAAVTGYTVPWVRILARRYNQSGPPALGDQRHTNPGAAALLSREQQAALAAALDGPAPDGGEWTGPKVARWMAERLGRLVHKQRGWEVLRQLQFVLQRPRPQHRQADVTAQAAFKKSFPR